LRKILYTAENADFKSRLNNIILQQKLQPGNRYKFLSLLTLPQFTEGLRVTMKKYIPHQGGAGRAA